MQATRKLFMAKTSAPTEYSHTRGEKAYRIEDKAAQYALMVRLLAFSVEKLLVQVQVERPMMYAVVAPHTQQRALARVAGATPKYFLNDIANLIAIVNDGYPGG